MTEGGVSQKPGLRLSQAQAADLLARHAAVLGRAQVDELQALGLDIIEAERGGANVTGADGRRYLDCIGGGGIYNLGRRPAEVLDGLRAAVALTDQGNFPLISAEKADFAARLAHFVPGELGCTMFSVSRGEAVDFACKLARACTCRPGLVTVDGGWYGHTGFALSLSERPGKERTGPHIPGVTVVPMNDLAAADLALHESTAAVILEPVQAENGCRCVEPFYLRELARLCRERGALLVLDETQTGMGRTGTRFAYGHWGVVPDILVLGESVAAGAFPICATLFRPDLEGFLNDHPLIHLSTFGGSDVGCLVGQRALDVYEREQPWSNAAAMGERLLASLSALVVAQPDIVKGVSGLGLLLAVDLGDEATARSYCRALAAAGVLVLPGVVAPNTVVLRPSLLITAEEADVLSAACATAAAALAAGAEGAGSEEAGAVEAAAKRPRRRRPAANTGAEKAAAEKAAAEKAAAEKAGAKPSGSRSRPGAKTANKPEGSPSRSSRDPQSKPRTRRKPATEQ